MSTVTARVETPRDTNLPDLVHIVCDCDANRALCGLDRTNAPWASDDAETGCVVCADLEWFPCDRCGE